MAVIKVLHDKPNVYNSICWYTKQKVPDCRQTLVDVLGDNNVNLFINEPVTIDNITITPNEIGKPLPSMEYRGEPKIYKELILEGPDEDKIISFIQEALAEYDKKCKTFKQCENELLVLTWEGCCWSDEYKTPKRSNKSIYLPDDSYQKIVNDLKKFYNQEKRYRELEIPYVRTYMLHGLPGTGKTSMIYTIATELGKNIAIIDFSDRDMSDKSIREAVYRIPSDTILCLEDMDSLFSADRKSDKPTITFSGVLNVLDGVIKNTGLVIFMTTNLLANMDDSAMKRRVDYYLKFDLMKTCQVENMFNHFFPEQDLKKFSHLVQKLQLTPCILQKFFVRHLDCEDIVEHVDELVNMCEHDYKILNNNTMYM
jgi:hypothetical protein